MVKNIGKGFLYTVGRILAYIFIFLVIATLVFICGKDVDLPRLLGSVIM